MMSRRAAVAVLSLLWLLPSLAWALPGRGYLDVDGGYKTGDFGTPVRSDLYSISTALGYIGPRYDVDLSIPYLFLTNREAGASQNAGGIGDAVVRGGRVLWQEGEAGFSLDGTLAVKFPSADRSKGLGTGEFDYGGFAGAHQRFGDTKLSLSAGYIKVGQPPGVRYNDVPLFGAGISQRFGCTQLSLAFEGRRALVPGAPNPQDLDLAFFHLLNADYSLKGDALFGLNKGAPDFGLNFGVVRWF